MLGATIEELRSVALDAGDASGYFAAMYTRVTDRVQAAIVDGRFGDGAQMERFARTFVDWYLGPRRGTRPLPTCWKAANDVAANRNLVIVQQLLLGMNAHINHDLPQVVVELADDGATLDELHPGFDAINDILGQTQPDILRDLGTVAGWTHVATAIGGGQLFNFSLDRARDQAWNTAVRLQPLDADARHGEVVELDRLVSVLSYLITQPSVPFRWLLPVARHYEDHDPPRRHPQAARPPRLSRTADRRGSSARVTRPQPRRARHGQTSRWPVGLLV